MDLGGLFEVAEIEFNLYTIIKNIQCVIFALPFGIIIITLFRYSGFLWVLKTVFI